MRVYLYVILSFFLFLPAFRPIEKNLEEKMMDGIPGLESARVRIDAIRPAFLLFGYCRRVEIELRGLTIGGLKTDYFYFDVNRIRIRPFMTFIRGVARVRSAGTTNWKLGITDAGLQDFLASRGPLLGSVVVKIEPTGITLHRPAGIARLLSIRETFTFCGKLCVSSRNNVRLELSRVSAFGFSPAQTVVRTIMSIANPIIKSEDINNMLQRNRIEVIEHHMPATKLQDIDIKDGTVEVRGIIELVPAPEKNNSAKEDNDP